MNKFLFPIIILLFSCGRPEEKKPAPTPITSVSASPTIKYAKGFRIDYYDHYRVLSLANHIAGQTDTLRYLLLPEGARPPADKTGLPVIHTPVKSLIVLSSSHVGLSAFAGVTDRIIGLGSLQYVSSPEVRQRIKTGAVKEVGVDNAINNELIVALHPSAVLTMSNPDITSGRNKMLADAGIPIMPIAEWLETTPLGRAEWVKVLAALTDREETVDRKFDSIAAEYQRLAAIGTTAASHPSVIIGMPFKGSWYMPAGESYMVRLLDDAGADYHWKDSKGTGSLSLNFEMVAPVALKADYWFNIGTADSKAAVAAVDARFTQFASFRNGGLYNNTLRTNDIGANDYWESGVANPQLILADLIRIMHPGLLPKDSLYYYKQLK
ncbi:MAG: ABC transporter substrate-binding protein [Bacteroidetes bacterium]|nr:ABC transporter substrate-binding protein [Bacteroidota bacterium]